MNTNPRSLLAALVALSLAVPGVASADRRDHDRRDYRHDYGHDHGNRHGQRQWYRERHHDHRDRHVTHVYRHDDDDDDDDENLLIGLVVGGILGYALNGAQHGAADYSGRYYPPAEAAAYPADGGSYGYETSDGTCLQEREYQTTVVVGGKNVPAYGTACLQPDGSWKREPAKLVSY